MHLYQFQVMASQVMIQVAIPMWVQKRMRAAVTILLQFEQFSSEGSRNSIQEVKNLISSFLKYINCLEVHYKSSVMPAKLYILVNVMEMIQLSTNFLLLQSRVAACLNETISIPAKANLLHSRILPLQYFYQQFNSDSFFVMECDLYY